jgi:aminoglycoside phosphotransferase (APT) family kinase protein
MTSSTPLPADVRHWVTHQLAGLTTVTDVSWPRDNSLVWRVTSGTQRAYVKVSPNSQNFAREVRAYHHAANCLGPDEAPRLLAADPDLRAILTSPLQGVIVKGCILPPEQEIRVHELAGRLLRCWHAQKPSDASGSARQQAVASVIKRTDEAVAHLEHAAHLLTDPQRTLVEQACRELPQLATTLPLVFRHGDFAPRNWMWNPDRGALALLDFEKADTGIAVEEFVWLFATTWPIHPHLKTACLTGFGRPLDEAEDRAMALFAALAATSYLTAGLTQHEPELVAKGQNAFGHLLAASC